MDLDETKVDGDDVLDRLRARGDVAAGNLAAIGAVLSTKLEALREKMLEEGMSPDLEKVVRETSRALSIAMETEGKIADARRDGRGGDGLDLAEARAEVRRRLDLRAAAR